MDVKLWMKAVRAPFFTASVVPVLLGIAMAWYMGFKTDVPTALLTVMMAVIVHAGVNLANDYFDHLSGNDLGNGNFSQFNGGSRVIQDKLLKPGTVFTASTWLLMSGLFIGLLISWLRRDGFLAILTVIGILLGYFYSANPFSLSYRGFGELAVAIAFGPLLVNYAFLTQTGTMTPESVLISIPLAMLIFLVLFVNEFPDYDADRKASKKTIVVSLGRAMSARIYAAVMAMVYGSVLLCAVYISPFVAVSMLTVLIGLKAARIVLAHHSDAKRLFPANAMTIMLHLSTGLLLIAGFLLDKFL
jgi:1,4-dihydroxy-2-naphthoate octaprenyltransferase